MSQAAVDWPTAGLLGGAITIAGLIGRGFMWLANYGDRRADRLAREEDELDESWSAYRKRIEARLALFEQRDAERVSQVTALRLAFEIVAGELRRVDPSSGALRRAEQLLVAAFPLDPIVPADLAPLLVRIDEADRA